MSEDRLELIRKGLERANSEGVEATVDMAAADAIAHPFPEWVAGGPYRGREGWRELLLEWTQNFDNFHLKVERLIDGGARVVALLKLVGLIRGTDAPVSQPVGAVFDDFREDGTIGLALFFLTWNEALESAGLSE
jgi:hypothetical protein